MPTYIKYKYVFSSFRFQVGSDSGAGIFFQLSRIRGKNCWILIPGKNLIVFCFLGYSGRQAGVVVIPFQAELLIACHTDHECILLYLLIVQYILSTLKRFRGFGEDILNGHLTFCTAIIKKLTLEVLFENIDELNSSL